MARVSEMATITVRDGDPSSNAYLLWKFLTGKKPVDAKVGYYQGVKGWEYPGNLTRHIYKLWPELSPSSEREKFRNFRSDVYRYLRATSNAVCTTNLQTGTSVVWWISDEWSKSNVVVSIIRMRETKREKMLTAKEAGEDRVPGEVTVDHLSRKHSSAAEEHKVMLEMAFEFISKEADNEPVSVPEIVALLDVHASTARAIVRRLVAEGKLFSRQETSEERATRFGGDIPRARRSKIFSHLNPVPSRTKHEVVKGFVSTYNKPENEPAHKGALEGKILNAMNTRWQKVSVIAERVGNITPANTRAVLNRLVEKGILEKKIDVHNATRYRLTKKLIMENEVAPVDHPPTTTTGNFVADRPPVEQIPEHYGYTPLDSLMQDIKNLVEGYAETQKPNPHIVDLEIQFERQAVTIRKLQKENEELRAENMKMSEVLAPLRALLQG